MTVFRVGKGKKWHILDRKGWMGVFEAFCPLSEWPGLVTSAELADVQEKDICKTCLEKRKERG